MSAAGKGHFFAIDRRIWASLCDRGTMNQAVAYLVLARGTGADNRTTSWSTSAVARYGGMGIIPSKTAIEDSIKAGFIRCSEGHTRNKPRYELARSDHREGTDQHQDDLIWLPNSIVSGASGNAMPPVPRLRASGDLWALRLLVDLYCAQNLRDDGGISALVYRQKFERIRVGEQGAYIVWGFKPDDQALWWTGPFKPHRNRKEAAGSSNTPVWHSLELLMNMGLLSTIPHLFENDSREAEIIHPYGVGNSGEEEVERQIGEAADAAARELAGWKIEDAERRGFSHFCPVVRTLPNPQLIGIGRLRYRPHTRRTSTWYAQLHEKAREFLKIYQNLSVGVQKSKTA